MSAFPIGVMLDSFRKPVPEALAAARELGAQGVQAHAGHGINGRGVDADVYVPWTEAELEEDVILREALEL